MDTLYYTILCHSSYNSAGLCCVKFFGQPADLLCSAA